MKSRIWLMVTALAFAVGLGSTIAQTDGEETGSSAYAGSQECLACHDDVATVVHHGADATDLNCESCHGPGALHAEGDLDAIRKMSEMTKAEQAQICTDCHTVGKTMHWSGSIHQRNDLGCSDCHAVHNTETTNQLLKKPDVSATCYQCHKMQRNEMLRSSHMPVREGKMTCTDCHNPHGSTSDAMLHDNSINDNCYRCHAEKRGPLLFEHPPVRENCLTCHEAHGSLHEALLVAKQPRLCQNCHIHSRHPPAPRGPGDRFIFNTGCLNCHSQIHGTNHPSGVRLMR